MASYDFISHLIKGDGANLGRLNSTTATDDTDGNGDFDQLYTYGPRSFSIWTGNGRLIYDSGPEAKRRHPGSRYPQLNVANPCGCPWAS
jgi:hypothetical protein